MQYNSQRQQFLGGHERGRQEEDSGLDLLVEKPQKDRRNIRK